MLALPDLQGARRRTVQTRRLDAAEIAGDVQRAFPRALLDAIAVALGCVGQRRVQAVNVPVLTTCWVVASDDDALALGGLFAGIAEHPAFGVFELVVVRLLFISWSLSVWKSALLDALKRHLSSP